MKKIAVIYTDIKDKFGLPRQSGIVDGLTGRIVFEPEYRRVEAVRGLEGFSHIWLLWEFEGFDGESFSPTVRPPKLGGNKRVGVFATRSPNRPNPIGLSAVKLVDIDLDCADAPVITVSGVDMKDKTKILDIKPYLPSSDRIPDAAGGFAGEIERKPLVTAFASGTADKLTDEEIEVVKKLMAEDPRPGYIDDPGRIYGMKYKSYDIRFTVSDGTAVIREIVKT